MRQLARDWSRYYAGADSDHDRTLAPSERLSTELIALPVPKSVQLTDRIIRLPKVLGCYLSDDDLAPLVDVLDNEYRLLAGGKATVAETAASATVILELDASLAEQEYQLGLAQPIRVTGGSYLGVAMGSVMAPGLLRASSGTSLMFRFVASLSIQLATTTASEHSSSWSCCAAGTESTSFSFT